MMNNPALNNSPLQGMETRFQGYLERRRQMDRQHMDGNGIPDYAFAMDYELRRKLDAIPRFYEMSRTIVSTTASRTTRLLNKSCLAIGPNQFPELYAIGRDCAGRLGIGVPNIYIHPSREVNAYTIASDDVEPIIVIYSGLYERMKPSELRFIIGHECGHIHNKHLVYQQMAEIVLNGGFNAMIIGGISRDLFELVLNGATIALKAWQRAMEVSSDRAGMICCDRLEDGYSALTKLMYGAAIGEHKVNIEEILKQLEIQKGSITRMEELMDTHPATARRLAAVQAFAKCELLYQWRPELKQPGETYIDKVKTDSICRESINIIDK